ncbi:hypothetical protein, partial [Candidatus Cardinium sp. cBcalN1]
QACQKIAKHINKSYADLATYDPQSLCLLVNGFSKWPRNEIMQQACEKLAKYINKKIKEENTYLEAFSPQHLANLVNGFAKWQEQADTQNACKQIAKYINKKIKEEDTYLNAFNAQGLATLVNGFSKWSEQENTQNACQEIAKYINKKIKENNRYLNEFNAQELSTLVNGFSKWNEQENTQNACQEIAQYINQKIKKENTYLNRFNAQELSTLVNGFSKWNEQVDTQNACQEIAKYINKKIKEENTYFNSFNSQDLSTLVNGFSKWNEQENSKHVCQEIAQYVNKKIKENNRYLEAFTSQGLSTLVNGLSKFKDQADSKDGCLHIAAHIIKEQLVFDAATVQDLIELIASFSRFLCIDHSNLLSASDHTQNDIFLAVLDFLGRQADWDNILPQATMVSVTRLLKACCKLIADSRLRIYTEVVPCLVKRIQALVGDATILQTTNLETLGNLCMGLYQLTDSKDFEKDSGAMYQLLINLFNSVKQKADLYISYKQKKGSDAGSDAEAYHTSYEAFTYYQLIKVYSLFLRPVGDKNAKGKKTISKGISKKIAIKEDTIKAIHAWIDQIFQDYADGWIAFSSKSLNLMSKVDASLAGYDETLNQLLENFIEKYRQTLQAQFPPKLIDHTAQAILNSLASHEPQLAAASGTLPFIKKDSNGKVIVQDKDTLENDTTDYCIAG